MEYDKREAMTTLEREFGYKPYPYKHYESVFTRFYQGFILPTKFSIDKRRVHLATLVASGQMTRGEALKVLDDPPYPSARALEDDKSYFIKKMRWRPDQLTAYTARPGKPHDDYPSEYAYLRLLSRAYRTIVKKRAL